MPHLINTNALPSRRAFLTTAGAAVASLVFGETTPDGQERPLRLALLSDTHIPGNPEEGYRGFSPIENLSKVVPQVAAATFDGVLIGGDLARLRGLPEDYARLRELIAPLTAKFTVGMALGNHDDRGHFLKAFPPETPSPVEAKHAATRDAQGLRFVLLDSLLAPNVTPGQLGTRQRAWLGEQLAASAAPTVLLVHHTLGSNDGELVDADRLFEIIRPHRHVKAILYGHSHRYEVREREGVQLINLPAVGYNFADSEPVGWVESIWTPQGVDLILHAVAGNLDGHGQKTSVSWAR